MKVDISKFGFENHSSFSFCYCTLLSGKFSASLNGIKLSYLKMSARWVPPSTSCGLLQLVGDVHCMTHWLMSLVYLLMYLNLGLALYLGP